MEISNGREIRGIKLKTLKKLFNHDHNANPFIILVI
jgi:hypothetical protein